MRARPVLVGWRRTIFAAPGKLCRQAGGSLEQMQFLLGHASIQSTERYLGGKQELRTAVNDNLGIGVP